MPHQTVPWTRYTRVLVARKHYHKPGGLNTDRPGEIDDTDLVAPDCICSVNLERLWMTAPIGTCRGVTASDVAVKANAGGTDPAASAACVWLPLSVRWSWQQPLLSAESLSVPASISSFLCIFNDGQGGGVRNWHFIFPTSLLPSISSHSYSMQGTWL